MADDLAAVVMAGGLGTRMKSATPKHLHPLLGRRMVDWVVQAARDAGIGRILVVASPDSAASFDGVEVAVLGHVDDAALQRLYRTARVLAYPSTYEGFGLPVLEAMVHGLPVVASDASGIPEAGGDAAIYVPPSDPSALAAALLRALHDDAERARRIEAGRRRVAEMTWERTARETFAVLQAASCA